MALWTKPPPQDWIAYYCVVCRDISAHRLMTDRSGSEVQLVAECEECSLRRFVNRKSFLNVCSPRPQTLRSLIERTDPVLCAKCLSRIRLERAMVGGELLPAQRAIALRAPFELLTYLAPPRSITAGVRRGAALWMLLASLCAVPALITVIVIVYFWVLDALKIAKPSAIADWILGCLIIGPGILYVFVTRAILRKRNVRRSKDRVVPMLARSLRPLRPTAEELSDVQAWLRASRNPLYPVVNFQDLAATIRTLPDTSLRNVEDLHLEAWGQQIVQQYREHARQQAEEAARPLDEDSTD